MFTAEVRFDDKALRRIERTVGHIPGAMNRIVPPSLNRTAGWVRTRMARAVAGQMGSKVGEARRQIRIEKATQHWWSAHVMIMNAAIPLIVLRARQDRLGVTYRLKNNKPHRRRHAFIATMPSGHRGVFKRRTRHRLPIVEQSIRLQKAIDTAFLPPLARAAGGQLTKEVAGRLRWQLERARRR